MALAEILHISDELRQHGVVRPEAWTEDFARTVAEAWLRFNTAYTSLAPKQFEKYARRLGRSLPQADAKLPRWVLAPYLMATPGETWIDDANDLLWRCTVAAAGENRPKLRRVFAAQDPRHLATSIGSSDEEEVVIWIDNLEEVDPANATRLAEYASSVATISRRGKRAFALYGGYFSVLLRAVGLQGVSHGIGFSEHRNHIELRTSGGAPARYYVERIHRYLPVDLASELWRQDPNLVDAAYDNYISKDPGEYTYHDLMKHSVFARADEIRRVEGASVRELRARLADEHASYLRDLNRVRLTPGLQRRLDASLVHLPVWAHALVSVE
ncbi:hypothetical protein [Agromyces marinus]|uniref:hypothetical protein n=1 Tax=Agromyces marinus TaxID=1389020 RepID=UPI001F3071BA|nr:hypothetical protein [Agromyces marinus]